MRVVGTALGVAWNADVLWGTDVPPRAPLGLGSRTCGDGSASRLAERYVESGQIGPVDLHSGSDWGVHIPGG